MNSDSRFTLTILTIVTSLTITGCNDSSSSSNTTAIGTATAPSGLALGQIPVSTSRTPKVTFSPGSNTDSSFATSQIRVENSSTGSAISDWSSASAGYVAGLNLSASTSYRLALRSIDSAGAPSTVVYSSSWTPLVGNGTWTATSISGAPAARTYASLVWTGDKMIAWGGGVPGIGFADTGGLYDPVSNSWTPTTTTNAPESRMSHSAIWTGTDMIVWGGKLLSTGAKYRPNSDTWTAISNVNAPPGRSLHTAIWTGSKMIVWGGSAGGSSYLNSGGIYDPMSDTWTATSLSGAPTARQSHTAIWTGSKMIVWGGSTVVGGTGVDLNDGASFDPATNTWSPVSMTGAPSPRGIHISVWTGSKMIIWGGRDSSGGIYDPVTDTWTALPQVGMPTGETDPTIWMGTGISWPQAVWTGSKLIVWSGHTGYGVTTTGAIYDPVLNSWAPTATQGAPAGRYVSGSVWTGSQMIVWGGYDGTPQAINSGGVYSP